MSRDAKKQRKTQGVRRDVRVDRIGLVNELVKNWIEGKDGVKARVKAGMKPGETVEGDLFTGRLDGCTESVIDASKLLKLLEKRAVSRPEFCSMIGVKVAVAKQVLDARTFARLCRSYPGTDRLTVERKDRVELTLVRAVTLLGEALLEAPQAA